MADQEEAPQFIHGVLEATIIQAKGLHSSEFLGSILHVMEKIEKAFQVHELPHNDLHAKIEKAMNLNLLPHNELHAKIEKAVNLNLLPHNELHAKIGEALHLKELPHNEFSAKIGEALHLNEPPHKEFYTKIGKALNLSELPHNELPHHRLYAKIEKALHLDEVPHSKLHATIDIGVTRLARTRLIHSRSLNPKWNESFRIYCCHSASSLVISVKDELPTPGNVLGRAKIPISRVLTGERVEGWFDLFDGDDRKLQRAKIHVQLKFYEAASDPFWNAGIKLPDFSGVRNTYFPHRISSEVTLYQNAQLSDGFHLEIPLSSGGDYRAPRLWEDLYKAIVEAKHFIYVAGSAVNTRITLVREPKRAIPGAKNETTVGELLKQKAEEGVTVLVMVWQDRTSLPLLGNSRMKTHALETYQFFLKTKVRCFLCPRNANCSLGVMPKVEAEAAFTHNQKTVTLDAPIGSGGGRDDHKVPRRIVSFIGGVDLCEGRYDDENHTLFGDLDTTYLNDFYQNNFPNADLRHGGPRQPWHDIHSKVEGLAAWDILTNFEQRWKKQAPSDMLGCLLKVQNNPKLFPLPRASTEDEKSWNVQVFRSIDDTSVGGFPSDPQAAFKMGLVSGKDVTVDQSIHSAYIEAIRRAKRFIYIENQFFIGSCASWKEDQDSECLNLVPIEIATKIASKIKERERFAVYVVTPMWPEGEPEGDTVQAILHWYRLTMEMMYRIIAKAIDDAGLRGSTHPSDFLNFYCLGKREVVQPGEYVPPERPELDTNYWSAQVNRRFPIYVGSKLMIVDDEYVIVGSANLNQRSLEGCRDTEIAHGSYQPKHLNSTEGRARGIVHGFRMSLWYEHFLRYGHDHPTRVFLEPESLECVRTVKQIAEGLWEKYVGEEVVDVPGHLLPFPIRVEEDGSLGDLPANGCFPGTRAPVKGTKSAALPPILTT